MKVCYTYWQGIPLEPPAIMMGYNFTISYVAHNWPTLVFTNYPTSKCYSYAIVVGVILPYYVENSGQGVIICMMVSKMIY